MCVGHGRKEIKMKRLKKEVKKKLVPKLNVIYATLLTIMFCGWLWLPEYIWTKIFFWLGLILILLLGGLDSRYDNFF